jgi:F420-non-reducing hydrogenase iron-sulfur subunit
MESNTFEPRILAFLCNWCSYAGADLAGVSRLQYPPNIRVIRVMCSGSVSPHHILHAFQKGADGVLVAGCHIGDCHYLKGNYMTIKRMQFLKGLLSFAGYAPDRLRLEWVSAAEGIKFAELVREFTASIINLGPATTFEAVRPSVASDIVA